MQKQYLPRARTLVLAAAVASPACAPQKETMRKDPPAVQMAKAKPAPAPEPVQEDKTDELINALRDISKPPELRVGIVKVFGGEGVAKAGPALAEALHSPIPELREAAVLAIGRATCPRGPD